MSEKRDKRGKNHDRMMQDRWLRFARHLLKCYAAAGHKIADRPVVFGQDRKPLHPDLEAAIKWGYTVRQNNLERREAIERAAEDLAAAAGDSAGEAGVEGSTEQGILLSSHPVDTSAGDDHQSPTLGQTSAGEIRPAAYIDDPYAGKIRV